MKDAKALSIQVPSAGQHLAYQPGDHHVNLLQYINDHFEDLFIHPENINNHQKAYNSYDYNIAYNDNNFLNQLNDDDDDDDSIFVENEQKEKLCFMRLNKLISFLELGI